MCACPQRNHTVSKFILGVDFGSTHACARVYTMDLKVIGCSSTKVPRLEGSDGACELDPEAVWESFCKLLDEVLQDAEINPDRINCIGISVQRNSLLLWDKKTSNPRTRVITWQDTRSLDLAKKLNHSFIFRSMKTAGHMLYWITHQSRFKALASYHFKTVLACIRLKYLLNEKPKLIDECRKGLLCYGCLETWLLWRLTGGKTFATDVSCASVTGMYDSFSRKWSRPILAGLGIPANILPGVYPSSYYYGTVQNGPLGYSSNPSLSIPITGIIGDAQAATLTENCLSPCQAKLTLGTGIFLNLISGSEALAVMNGFYPVIGWASGQAYFDRIPTFDMGSTSSSSESPSVPSTSRSVHLDNLTYLVEGFYPHAGTLIDWLQSENIFCTYSELEEMLYSGDQLGLDEKATRENIFYIPLLRNTLKNHQNMLIDGPLKLNKTSFYGPDGFVIGLDYSKSSDKLLVARIFIESIAFCTKFMIENCRRQTRISPSILYVNGNVARSNWLLQRMSNTIGIPVERRGLEECSCIGAAIVAGVGAGLWPSFSAATEAIHKRLQSEANSLPSADINNTDLNNNNKLNSHTLYRRFMPESSEICISIKKRYHIWSHIRASYLRKKLISLKLV